MNRQLTERYLRATRSGLTTAPIDPSDAQALVAAARRGLPDIGPLPAFLGIASRQRRWEYLHGRGADADGVLIVDRSLEDALLDLQHLMMLPEPHVAAPALSWVLAADAFREEGVFDAYHLFAQAALDHVDKLTALMRLRARRHDHVTREFLLFHELGHVAIAQDRPWTRELMAMTERMRASLLGHIEARLAAPDGHLEGFVHGAGKPMDAFTPEERHANLAQYRDVAAHAETLVEEATCDMIAAIALAGLPGGISYLDAVPERAMGSWRMGADSLFLAARLVRLLGLLGGMRHLARSFAPGFPPFHNGRYQIELSLRFNIVTNLAMAFNRDVLSQISFAEGSGFPNHIPRETIVSAFDASIVRDGHHFDRRVFAVYEVIEPARDPATRAADLAVGGTVAASPAGHLAAGDRVRERITL